MAEVEAEKEKRAVKAGDGATRPAPGRTIGNLPAALPRIEEVVEPASLICPCGCGVAIVSRSNGVTWLIVVCFYAPGRAGENAETFLTGFDGILQIDGDQGCNRLTKPSRKGGAPVRVAHCRAQARRKLKEVFDRDGSDIAAEGLRRSAEFHAIEADIRGISPGQRLSARRPGPRHW